MTSSASSGAKLSSMKGYAIILSPGEIAALDWVGARYNWTCQLLFKLDRDTGSIEFEEHEMWEWAEAVEKDMEGGHDAFTCASPTFAKKLQEFLDLME